MPSPNLRQQPDGSILATQALHHSQFPAGDRKIFRLSVYNDKDEKVGSIDDLIIGTDRSLHAVIDVGGVMGIGGKMVAMPFEKLQFTNVKGSSDNHVVMPGAT